MANIDQQKELNKLLEEQAKIYAAQEQTLKNQLNITQQLVSSMQDVDLNSMASEASNLNRAINEAAGSVEKLGQGQQTTDQIKRSLQQAAEQSDDFGDSITNLGEKFLKLAPIVGTLEGAISGFQILAGGMTSVLSIGRSLIGAFFNITAAIIATPFRLLGYLMGQAAQGGAAELRQQIENVRKQFGDLAKNESKAVMTAWRGVDHFGGQLAETGLNVWRTMGNMAEQMQVLRELAEQLGPTFTNLRNEFAKNAERLFAYQKGLGLSEDAIAGLGRRAQYLGIEMQEVGRQVTQMAYGMGEAFGINGKLISRDVGEMISDFENFGNLAIKELSGIAVYARKLGVEVKQLLGVVNTFDNFEDAATSVAQLSQAFGLQLDTLELVNAQNPADRIEALRKSFFQAGRSIETMTRQERALLATQTGLDQNTLQMVFSQENAAMSYEQIRKQGEATEKQQISQAEAMEKLANSIERIVRQGSQMEASFFKIFIKGFAKGIRFTSDWWGLMWRLRRAMRAVRWAGVRVGQAFVKFFPGVKQFLGGLRELFDRKHWRKMLFGAGGVVGIFKEFFKSLAGDSPMSISALLDKFKQNFFNWFSKSEGAGRKVLGGIKTFMETIIKIVGQLAAKAVEALGKALSGIAGLIENPDKFLNPAAQAGKGIQGYLFKLLRPAFESLVEAWPVLKKGFMDLVSAAWGKIKPALINFFKENWQSIFLVAFGPSVVGALVNGLAVSMGSMLLSSLKGATGIFAKGAGGILGKAFSKLGGAGKVGNVMAGGKNAKIAGDAAGGLGKTMEQLGKTKITGKTIGNMLLIGTAITVGLAAVVTGLIKLAEHIQEAGIGIKSIAKAGFAMVAAGGVMIELAAVMKIMSTATQGLKPSSLIVGVLAVGAVGTAMAFGIKGLIELFKDVTTAQITTTLGVMTAAAVIVGEISLSILAMTAVGAVTQALAAQVAIGIGAIAIVGGAMAYGIKELIDTFKGYTKSSIDKTLMVTEAANNFFTTAIGVIVGSGIIGAVTTFTGGVGAAVIAVGFTQLTATMMKMTDSVKAIIDKVSKMNITPAAMTSLTAFITVLESVGKFAKDIGSVLEIAMPSVSDLVFGNADMSKKIEQANEFIETLSNKLSTIVTTLVNQSGILAGKDKNALQAAATLGQLLAAVGTLAGSLQPGGEYMEPGFWDKINPWSDGGDKIKKLDALRDYYKTLFGSLKGVIKNVVNEIKQVGGGGNLTNLDTGLEAVTQTFKFFNSLTNAAQIFKGQSENMTGAKQQISAYLGSALGILSGEGGKIIGIKQFAEMLPIYLESIGRHADPIYQAIPDFRDTMKYIKAVSESIDYYFNSESMQAIGELNDAGIERIQKGVVAMIENINDFGKALNNIKGVNLNSELQAVSDRLGLKGGGKLTINQQPVTLNVNFTVKIDSEELEKSLIEREGSRFVSRDKE